ncbi:unnamed protein product, partial [Prorocentrum cordatum]
FSPLAHLRNLATPHVSYRLCRAVGASPTAQAGVAEEMEKLRAWALAAGCRWTPEASGRAAQRRARATGAPAPARPSFKGRAGQGRDADAARWRSLGQTAVRCHTCGTTQRAN